MEAGELVVDAVGGVRVVTLHRPSKRNVLSRAMVADLLRVWRQFEASDDVKCVVLRGSGDFPCLCAGGDVRAVHDLRPPPGEGDARRRAPPPGALEFFEREYEMNAFLAAMRTPHVAIMDGIVMGGGCGVSIHGAFRVATERTVLSMPECAIGLVPDVGGTHFLARLPGETGTRLALTGARVGGADALATGLATHVVPSSDVPKLVDILDSSTRHAASADAARDAAAAALAATQRASASAVAALNLGPGASRRADDDEWFAGDTIDEIRDALARAAGEGNARARASHSRRWTTRRRRRWSRRWRCSDARAPRARVYANVSARNCEPSPRVCPATISTRGFARSWWTREEARDRSGHPRSITRAPRPARTPKRRLRDSAPPSDSTTKPPRADCDTAAPAPRSWSSPSFFIHYTASARDVARSNPSL